MKAIFKKRENQDEKLLKNMKRYEQKEKAKQQESKILGQKLIKRATNSKESTNVHNSSRM
tara:strand:- start:731 stop:910 length:180 start_codon:yes stop_codon:yes gene_type:complete